MKSLGGIAPFGYCWRNGNLVIDNDEAKVRKLIYELFLKHRRKRTVAKLLNDLGYRTRSKSLFSDTTIDRLLRDPIVKGLRQIDGKVVEVERIISAEIWERANNILGGEKPPKQSSHLFSGVVYCGCGGKMIVSGSSGKYVCIDCRSKILADDLEVIFHSQLKEQDSTEDHSLFHNWPYLTQKEKRILIEQICSKIVVEHDTIHIEFSYSLHSNKTPVVAQQNQDDNETTELSIWQSHIVSYEEPLLSEIEAAKFLGISNITLSRKRKAGNIGFFRVGFRVLYSKEKHLIPFLDTCEK